MTPGPARTRTVAALCSLGFILMTIVTIFNVQPIIAASGAHYGKGDIVTYTFVEHRCIGGDIQYRSCGWTGRVTQPSAAPVNDVFYRDSVPENTAPGMSIDALWQVRDPHSAYDIEQSDAWTSSIMSAAVAGIAALLYVIGAIIWGKRSFQRPAQPGKSKPTAPKPAEAPESVSA